MYSYFIVMIQSQTSGKFIVTVVFTKLTHLHQVFFLPISDQGFLNPEQLVS